MTASQRQQQFEQALAAQLDIDPTARVAKNFGFSNSARVIEGGLFACTSNQASYSVKLAKGTIDPSKQFVFLCVLSFPPQDEVYFSIIVNEEANRVNRGLLKLYEEGLRRQEETGGGGISNNVKFYVTNDGNIFFHNYDFRESLLPGGVSGELDSERMAKVDAIHFAIWPPATTAHRSLIAREFVGYLGSLIGRERVHELRVWDDGQAVGADMQRMPASIPLPEIEAAVAQLGGYYPGGEVRRFHAALNFLPHKHFVILSGLSGTGKTQLALNYARAVHGVMDANSLDPLLVVCPVRPEWTDPSGLTGYFDVLSNRYMVPPFLEAVLLATAHRNSPVFVVLDEMNLSRVEYYLSDVLSAMEAREPLRLHSSGVPLEGSTGITIPSELPLPHNLFIIGTINIDETTNPVSDKVLDRAMVIDMSDIDLAGFFEQLGKRFPELAAACDACQNHLVATHDLLVSHGQGFGYRVAEEVVRYHAFAATHLVPTVTQLAEGPGNYQLFSSQVLSSKDAVSDDLMIQKILVKLRGAERQRSLLTGLQKAMQNLPRSQVFLARLLGDLDEFGSFQASR